MVLAGLDPDFFILPSSFCLPPRPPDLYVTPTRSLFATSLLSIHPHVDRDPHEDD